MLGIVEEVIKSKDDVVRKVVIKYQNANENVSRTTERATRKIIKLFHIDDTTWRDDMEEVSTLWWMDHYHMKMVPGLKELIF